METFDPTKFGATPLASTSSFDPTKFGATSVDTSPISTNTPTPSLDQKLSDMPGVLGGIGSGIYNAAKGVGKLVGSAAVDTFQAINHPIDSAKTAYDFIKGELTGGANPDSLDTLGKFAQGTAGSKGLLGVAQIPGKVINEGLSEQDKIKNSAIANDFFSKSLEANKKAQAATDPKLKQDYLEQAKQFNQAGQDQMAIVNGTKSLTQKNIAGTVLNAGLTALTFGEGNLAADAVEQGVKQGLLTSTVGQFLKSAATSFAGRAVQSGGITTGFQVGSNLQEDRPIGEGVRQGFFTGLALPGLLQGAGKVINKVTPELSSVEAGSDALRKSIGFRGGNIKEKTQFENAVPVVFKELKDSGFKLTDATDPNNLINLDKAVQDSMTKILEERTARIQKTGQDATVSGNLAADRIRNLVEPGSVEDLTNPNMRERLDAIAKNFEGKKYTPVEAQKAIVQANTGFSFSDNPVASKQIKMAISQAFTPELDRIVGGAEKVVLDAKGKPIAAKGGTAELNKRWSALKAFKDQLEKKLTIEDRKANYNLPDRLTGAEIAGKVGEAVGNPMKVPEKIMGGGFEYLANKIMGDRNNVNYRIYKAFNGQPMGVAVVNLLNKFSGIKALGTLLEQNPLIQHLLEKILGGDSELQAKENLIPNREGGFVSIGGKTFKEIPDATKAEMVKAIDYLRIGKKSANIEDTVSRLARKYGISEDFSNNKIADLLEKLVEQTKTK